MKRRLSTKLVAAAPAAAYSGVRVSCTQSKGPAHRQRAEMEAVSACPAHGDARLSFAQRVELGASFCECLSGTHKTLGA